MKKKICASCGRFVEVGTQCICKNEVKKIEPVKKDDNKNKDPIHSQRWRKKRKEILKRDGVCQRCFIKYKMINYENLTVHHIISRKNHPELMFEDSNLICLCDTCNKQLGTKDELDFEWNKNKNKEINEVIL